MNARVFRSIVCLLLVCGLNSACNNNIQQPTIAKVRNVFISDISWSPIDSRMIVVANKLEGEKETDSGVFIIDYDSELKQPVKILNSKVGLYSISWSPDAKFVCYSKQLHLTGDIYRDLLVKSSINDLDKWVQLTSFDEDCRAPKWCSDGDNIIYISNPRAVGDPCSIKVLNLKTKQVEDLLNETRLFSNVNTYSISDIDILSNCKKVVFDHVDSKAMHYDIGVRDSNREKTQLLKSDAILYGVFRDKFVLYGNRQGVGVIDINNGSDTLIFKEGCIGPNRVDISHDGRYLAFGGGYMGEEGLWVIDFGKSGFERYINNMSTQNLHSESEFKRINN